MELTEKEQKALLKFWELSDMKYPDYEMGDGSLLKNKHWFQTFKKLVERIKKAQETLPKE